MTCAGLRFATCGVMAFLDVEEVVVDVCITNAHLGLPREVECVPCFGQPAARCQCPLFGAQNSTKASAQPVDHRTEPIHRRESTSANAAYG
jgi:hypothetical protein